MARSQRTKITLSDVGVPGMVATKPEGTHFCGTLIGIADGFVERKSADKQDTFEGLKGQFRSVPSDAQMDELESGVLFIPAAFHNVIATKLREVQKVDASSTLSFAYEVTSIKAKNPAGYSWDLKPLIDDATANPIDKFINEQKLLSVSGKTALAIEDRSKKVAAAKVTDKGVAKK